VELDMASCAYTTLCIDCNCDVYRAFKLFNFSFNSSTAWQMRTHQKNYVKGKRADKQSQTVECKLEVHSEHKKTLFLKLRKD
jgi:hypothetical protein